MKENIQLYSSGLYDKIVRQNIRKKQEKIYQFLREDYFLLPNYESISAIVNRGESLHLFPICDANKKIGFVNSDFDVIISPQYDDIQSSFRLSTNIVAVKKETKWNVIDSEGNVLLERWYNMVFPSYDSRMVTIADHKKAIVNVDNASSLKFFEYTIHIDGFRYGFARVENSQGKWGIINEQGDIVLDTIYEGIYSFYDYPCPTTKVQADKDSGWKLIELKNLLTRKK